MNIVKKTAGNKLTIALEGRLDTTTSPQLEAELKTSLEGVSELVMDMADLQYISSAGLRVLLTAQKAMNQKGSMKLVKVGENIMEVLEITGFTDILTIE